MKHCDLARSCFSHQSPFFLHSAATFGLHKEHSSSGTPCSSHHQPSCFVSPLATSVACTSCPFAGPELFLSAVAGLLHPATIATARTSKPGTINFRMRHSP